MTVTPPGFYRKLLDYQVSTDEILSILTLKNMNARHRFCQLDEWEVRAAATRIRQYQFGRSDRPRKGLTAAGSSELGVLQREVSKKRKHMPLRR